MSRNLVRPFFSIPPTTYSQSYFSDMVRNFSVYLDQQQNPGEGRNTTIVLTNLQEDDFGLETGTIFQQDGYLKISRLNVSAVRGVSASASVGSVSVVTA